MHKTLVSFVLGAIATGASAQSVSFHVDPTTIDVDPADGFITGTEFSPVGTDGVGFTMEPTDNLVGIPKFHLSAANGMTFGGGGGSTLSFDFTTTHDILLQSYTISATGFILNDPTFDIREGTDVLSASNTAVTNGDTHAFAGGPIAIDAGTTYTFINTAFGAGTQSHMSTWQYTLVPTPSALGAVALGAFGIARRRR